MTHVPFGFLIDFLFRCQKFYRKYQKGKKNLKFKIFDCQDLKRRKNVWCARKFTDMFLIKKKVHRSFVVVILIQKIKLSLMKRVK